MFVKLCANSKFFGIFQCFFFMLLPKKGDLKMHENSRPISQNSFSKIFEKVIHASILKYMTDCKTGCKTLTDYQLVFFTE